MNKKVVYKTAAVSIGGREGSAQVVDGWLNLPMRMPKEIGGRGGDGTDPEQLFAAGFATCFFSSMQLIAGRRKEFTVPADTSVRCDVGLFPRADGGYALDVEILVRLPGMDPALALRFVEAADKVCPYSNATRGNIDVRLSLA